MTQCEHPGCTWQAEPSPGVALCWHHWKVRTRPLAPARTRLKRNTKTAESRKFWDGVDRTAARVDNWPPWMRGEAPSKLCCQGGCNKPAPDVPGLVAWICGDCSD